MKRNPYCELCKLHEGAHTVCVWGDRPGRSADILVVGEAPGAEEDAQGTPFVGRAGQGLRQVLGDLQLLKRVEIHNVVRCRPPGNRVPTVREIRACRPYLDGVLKKGKWKYVVLLGSTAIRWALGDQRKTVAVREARLRKGWDLGGAHVIATYHPAAALRAPELWPAIVDDLSRILEGDFIPQTPLERQHRRPKGDVLVVDIETTVLDPWKEGGSIEVVGVASLKGRPYADGTLGYLAAQGAHTWIGHNIKFDALWLRRRGYYTAPDLHDTMLQAHLLDENRPKGLKTLAQAYTGYGDYVGRTLLQGEGNLEEYCCYDVAATAELHRLFLPELKKQGLMPLYDVERQLLPVLVDVEHRGILIDQARLEKLLRESERRIDALKSGINQGLLENGIEPINLASTKQLGELLYGRMGLTPLRRTPKGKPSVDVDSLEAYSSIPFVKDLLELRKEEKLYGTYLAPYQTDHVKVDGRVHPSYNPCGTETGRLSCSNPNLQNVPSTGDIKTIFIPDPGYILLQIDYSQIELRLGACITGDPTMKEHLSSGMDVHETTARAIFGIARGKKVQPEQRRLAKTINFGIFYGAGPGRISGEAGVDYKTASELIDRWFGTYPTVRRWIKEQEQTLLERGYVADPIFGRRRRLPSIVMADRERYLEMLRQACNAPIQGAAAQICKLAMLSVANGYEVLGNIHDALLVQVKDMAAVPHIRHVMEGANALIRSHGFRYLLDVPTPVEIKVGTSWGCMKVLEEE